MSTVACQSELNVLIWGLKAMWCGRTTFEIEWQLEIKLILGFIKGRHLYWWPIWALVWLDRVALLYEWHLTSLPDQLPHKPSTIPHSFLLYPMLNANQSVFFFFLIHMSTYTWINNIFLGTVAYYKKAAKFRYQTAWKQLVKYNYSILALGCKMCTHTFYSCVKNRRLTVWFW